MRKLAEGAHDEGRGRVPRSFFAQPTLDVARALLGGVLVRRLPDGRLLRGRVVETEAYLGEGDGANYFIGRRVTARNAPLFGPPGHVYVHLLYRVHACLNLSTERAGRPSAVLVRAVEPLEGIEWMQAQRPAARGHELTNGPAKLCQAFAIDRALNGADCVAGEALWFEAGAALPDEQVEQRPRVGLNPAEPAARLLPWRFFVRGNPWVSRTHAGS